MKTESVENAPLKQKQKSILIVEDDNSFRRLLARTLATQGFHIREAESGLVAKTIFDLDPTAFDAILSDVRMPGLDGSELLRHVRLTSKIPFIVMTGFSEVMDTATAFELGANDFVPKPFRIDVLLAALLKSMDKSPAGAATPTTTFDAPVYCPIPVDEFISSTRLQSDIYIKLNTEHFIRVAYKGESTPIDRLRVYKNKAVEYLFVTAEDFAKYVNFNVQITNSALKKTDLNRDGKMQLLTQTTAIIVEQCFLDGINKEIFKPAQTFVESVLGLLMQDKDVFDLFASMNKRSDRLYSHSVAVAMFSAMAARQNGWVSSSTLFKVVTAALLHDIGKREIDPELLKKRRLARSFDETKVIETHPGRGRDIIRQLVGLPEDIAQIVHQHHETPTGTGFPLQVSARDIHPLARLVGTIDEFVELTLPSTAGAVAKSPAAAMQWLRGEGLDKVDIVFVRKLEEMFQDKTELQRKAA